MSEDESATGGLSLDAVVVRGGKMKRRSLVNAAERHNLIRGGYAISVWCLPERTGEQIAAYSTEAVGLNYPDLRETTVGRLYEAGFEMTQTGKRGHYTLWLPSPPSDSDWQRLDEIFSEPKPLAG